MHSFLLILLPFEDFDSVVVQVIKLAHRTEENRREPVLGRRERRLHLIDLLQVTAVATALEPYLYGTSP
jgi:hypothetical protein